MSKDSPQVSFFTALISYTNQKALKNGQTIHSNVIKSGASCIYILNSLVNLYSKCGRHRDALKLFNEIPSKDIVSWNSLINANTTLHDSPYSGPSISLQLFRRMRREIEQPNGHTLSGVLSAIAGSSSLLESHGERFGKQTHALAIKSDHLHDTFVCSCLINLYCKLGCLLDARKMFNKMSVRNEVCWATMMSGYSSRRLVRETLDLFNLIRKEENVYANEFVYTSTISSLAASEFKNIGEQLHSLLVKNGAVTNTEVTNSLVTMYAKCLNLPYAYKMFLTSEKKNRITWSAMVTGFSQSGDSLNAIQVFSNMHKAGFLPNEYTIVGLLNACSDACAVIEGQQIHSFLVNLGYEHHTYVITASVDMYAKCGYIEQARRCFNHLVTPDVVLWTSMISGYVQNGENEEALALFCKMRTLCVFPNELTFSSLLKACSSLASLSTGQQIHATIVKFGFPLEIPVGSNLATMYTKCGSLKDGEISFRETAVRDVVSWNAMISGASQNGEGEKALKLFEEMREEGVIPDSVTFVNVLSACSHMGLIEKAWECFDLMRDLLVERRVEHYACMVDGLCRAGKVQEARGFIEEAPVENKVFMWRILMSGGRSKREYETAAYAGEKIVELGCEEWGDYGVLAGVYGAMGKREECQRVRGLMRGKKEPGCSWIGLNSRFHVFVVADHLHPSILSIRFCLETMRLHMDHYENIICF